MKKLEMRIAALLILMVMMIEVNAQNYPITDRSFAYATAFTIPQGGLQLEGGYFNVHNLEKQDDLSLGGFQSLLRYGISESTEIRAGMTYNSLKVDPDSFNGLSGIKLGVKTQLAPEGQWLPALSLLAEFETPELGSETFTPERLTPSLRLIGEKYINDIWIFGTNIGWLWTPLEPQFTYAFTLRTAITDEIALYTEYYGQNGKTTPPIDFVDVALEFWVWDNVAIDFVVGWGVTEFSDGGFISIGGGVTLN